MDNSRNSESSEILYQNTSVYDKNDDNKMVMTLIQDDELMGISEDSSKMV